MNGKKLIVGGVVVAVLVLGGGAALAGQQNGEEEAPIEGGSIIAPAGSGEENETAPETPENEAAEEKAEVEASHGLEKLTRIGRAAAEEAALGTIPGEVREVELENENGFVVYEVEVASDDGKLHEVVVDAGDGEILGQEVEEEEGS